MRANLEFLDTKGLDMTYDNHNAYENGLTYGRGLKRTYGAHELLHELRVAALTADATVVNYALAGLADAALEAAQGVRA